MLDGKEPNFQICLKYTVPTQAQQFKVNVEGTS